MAGLVGLGAAFLIYELFFKGRFGSPHVGSSAGSAGSDYQGSNPAGSNSNYSPTPETPHGEAIPQNQPRGTGAGGGLTLADVTNALNAASESIQGQSSPIFTYLNANSQTLMGLPGNRNQYSGALAAILPKEFSQAPVPTNVVNRLYNDQINPLTYAIASITGKVGGGYIPGPTAQAVPV